MIARIWQENRRFILIAGAGLAVFLIINSVLGSYIGRVDTLTRKSSELAKSCRRLQAELKPLAQERLRLKELIAHETQLREELALPPEKELEKLDTGSLLVQFNSAVDRAWGQATEKANQAGIALPEKLGPRDFAIESGDDAAAYAEHYAYLGIARRGLHALIDAGMAEIGRPRIEESEHSEVLKDDAGVECVARSVRFTAGGQYAAFVKLLKSLQEPGAFLQASIDKMSAKAGDDRLVKADLTFTAVSLVETAAGAPAGGVPGAKSPSREGAPRKRR